MSTFAEEYQRLNEAQKLAVDTIEGPVMVVAGPGTGKTQVLGMRVANILQKAHVSPRSILCLTYTNSGATAMRERLRKLIGPPAYSVTINTIHGFCNDVIAQHPHVFETWSSLEQISDVEQYREVNKIIDSLLPDVDLVNKKSPYTRTKDIISRISQVKREGKTIADLQRVADAYETEMDGKSKEGTKAHEKNVASARKFHDFVRIFGLYQDMLGQTQRYDYDDMILHVLHAMQEEDWMLQALQERFLYILVDEFQDTNGAQFQVIEKLTTPRTPEDKPNMFIVGDDDQAIYRFQGANIQNIMHFKTRFPGAPIIVLTTSYRCTQPILDAAGRLIAFNTERLVGAIEGLTKDLTSVHGPKRETDEEPLLLHAPSDVSEPWMIADMVEDEIKAGATPSQIAILVQKNSELRPIYDIFRARGIPIQMDGKVALLDQPLVRQVISILRGIEKPESNAHFSAALAAACLGCHPADLGRLFHLARERMQQEEKGITIMSLMLELDHPDSELSLQPWHSKECLIQTRDLLFGLHQQLPNRTLIDTLEHVMRECGLLPDVHSKEQFDPLEFGALQAFFEFVRYRSYEVTSFDFRALMSDLELYTNPEYNLRLSFTLPHLTQEGVQLLTAHQSKGLEYDVVILPNFRDGHWDKRKTPPSVSVPEDLLYGWQTEQKSYEQHQDERRIAYVAMTRARRKLIFTCPDEVTTGSKPKQVSPSGFFVEAGPLPEKDGTLRNPETISTLLQPPPLILDDAYKAFLLERLKDFRLSVTALNHFLEDPLLFLERDLLRKPELKTENLIYGNAVHAALKKWGMSVQEGRSIGLDLFLREFDNYITEREILTELQRKSLLKHGQIELPRYYEQRLTQGLPVIYKVEFPIKAFLGDVPLKGTIDRIELSHPDSNKATIIDFKTGRPKSENQIREEEDYYRQLVFYAILMEQGMPMYEPVAYILDFVGEGTEHPVQRVFNVTEQEKKDLGQVIGAVWQKILELDFTPIDQKM